MLLDEICSRGTKSDTYKLVDKWKEQVIDNIFIVLSKRDMQARNIFKTLPIMHWLRQMHKTPPGATFIVSFRKLTTRALPRAVTKALKLIRNQIQSFYEKIHFTLITKGFG